MKFSIRVAAVEDIEQIQRLRRIVRENVLSNPDLVTDEDCKFYLTHAGKGWVAESNKKILGFAIVDVVERNVWALFVDPEYEMQGIGKKLHNTMLNWFFGFEKSKLWLSTDPNTRAEIFYEKQGWNRTGELPNKEIRFEMSSEQWMKRVSERS